MASLQPTDPRSRGRSKSPSGRTRERSTSRKPYRESSSTGRERDRERERLRSRSRDPRSRRSRSRHRSRSRYDVPSDEDSDLDDASDWYRRGVRRQQQDTYRPPLPPRRGRYYHSDEEDEDEEPASYHLNPSRFASESEESDSSDESVDERLAYGDLPGERKSRLDGYKFWSSSPRVSDSQPHSGGGGPGAHTGGHGEPAEEPGQHPSYARLNPFKYANPLNYLQSSHTGHSPTTTTTTPASPSNWAPVPECEMPGFVPPSSQAEGHSMPGAFPPPDASHGYPYVSQSGRPLSVPASAAYNPASHATVHHRTSSGETNVMPAYANPAPFQYAQLDPNIRYSSKNSTKPFTYSTTPQYSHHGRHHSSSGGTKPTSTSTADVKHSATKHHYPQGSSGSSGSHDPRYVEITPGSRRHGRSHSHSGNNLSVAKPDPSFRPASPMQEPYRGTYQSISPMPSPIVIPTRAEDDISDAELEPHKSDEGRFKSHRRKKSKDDRSEHKESRHEGSSHKRERSRIRHDRHHSSQSLEPDNVVLISPGASQQQKRVSFYDPAPDARAMKEALSHTRHIDYKTLTRILPHLDSEDMLDLRKEYKHHVKLHGKGINMAKHLRLKLGSTSFGKACYATALGRWESEAHWANCYYQSGSSRRELLIESLMGRRNSEIRAIKECFRDSRYVDSLEKCMKAELKADKFRTAVLLALDERRQSEREPLDRELVGQDVYDLHRALVSPDGGETAMIYIIVRRSDAHLREVLRRYEKGYRQNFAKAMIAKSQNLVVRPSSFIPFLCLGAKLIDTEKREKPSPTSSTAPSTAPCATPSSSTKPYANRAPAKNAPNCSSRA